VRALDGVVAALAEHSGATSSWLVGEPCVPPPVALREALARASQAETFGYAPPLGNPRLREILAAHHAGDGRPTAAEQVVITSGAKGGLLAVFAAVLDPGDELIHPVPSYPAYPAMAARLGARPVAVAEGNGTFDGWPQAVADHIGPKTRAVVLSSPSNPTGATLTEGQARALVDLCRDRGIRLICDEAYTEFQGPPDTRVLPADFDPDRRTVVQVRSASKSWALCGWRMGWVVADPELAARVAARHASLFNPASGPMQEALTALPLVPGNYLDRARRIVSGRIDTLAAALGTTGLKVRRPAGGFYLWLDVGDRSGGEGTAAFCTDLARQHGVGLWPGEDFGGSSHVRLAVTAPPPEQWDAAVATLVAAMTSDGSPNGV
jgi:aspartate/methionine/tyrosine aminotransferase